MNDSVVMPRVGEQQQVNSYSDFQRNCYLLENALGDSMTDPRPSLQTLQTWIDWVNRGMGTPKHDNHLYTHCLPRVANGFLRRSFNLFSDPEIPQHVVAFLVDLVRLLVLRFQQPDVSQTHLETIHNILNPNHLFYQCHGHAAASVTEIEEENTFSDQLPDDVSPGAIVDAFHPIHRTWLEAVVMNRDLNQVYVAFFGVEQEGDCWISLEGGRIAPRGHMAQGRRGQGPIRPDLEESIPDETDPRGETNGYPFAIVRPRVPCSHYFVELINTFGVIGGFQKLPILQGSSMSISVLTTTLSLLANIFPWLTRAWATELHAHCATWIHQYLNQVELRPVTKTMLDTLHIAYKSICRRLMNRHEASVQADTVLLQICLKCLHSSVLEIRLHGLKCVTDFVSMIRQAQVNPMGVKFVAASSVSHLSSPTAASPSMVVHVSITESTTKQQFAEWFASNKLLQLLCESHEQVIRRAPELVRFLCEAESFDLASLDLIWNAMLSSGPDVRASLFYLLESLASYVTIPVCSALLDKINAFGIGHANVLGLVGALAKYAPIESTLDEDMDDEEHLNFFVSPNPFHVNAVCRYRAMEMLWTTMQDSTDETTRNLFDTAKGHFQDAIKANVEDEWNAIVVGCVSYLLELAMQSLRDHLNVPQAFSILGYLLQLLEEEKTQIVRVLERQGLLQIILDDLLVFKTTYAPFHGRPYHVDEADSLVLPQLNALLLQHGSHVDYLDQLKARLGFLSLWLSIEPSLNWTFAQLALVWTTLNAKATITTERTMFFKWLTTNALHLSPSNVTFIFQELLGNEDFVTSNALTPLSLQCFLCFFRLTNHHHSRLVLDNVASVNTQNQFTIQRLPLMGMSTLWTILLHGSNTLVFTQTMKFLTLLPYKVVDGLEFHFLSDGLDHLRNLAETAPASKLRRCLLVLSSIIGTDEASALALATGQWVPHGKASRGPPLHLTINNTIKITATSGQKLHLQVYANDTVLEMEVAVAQRLDAQPLATKGLRFFRMGSEIHELSRCLTLAEAGFKDGDTVLVVYRPNIPLTPLVTRPPVVFDVQLAQVLMQIIQAQDPPQEAWDLLMRLPTPPAMVDDIRTHSDDWTTLFSPRLSVTQLLYRLQVLENLISTDDNMLTTFVTTDGPACIVDLLMSADDHDAQQFVVYLRKECSMVCLRLIMTFLSHSATYQEFDVPKATMTEFDPEHLNIDLLLVMELILSPYQMKASVAQEAITASNTAMQNHIETFVASMNYPALHAACSRIMSDALKELSVPTLDSALRVYLICAPYSPLFTTLPSDVLAAISSPHRDIRHLICHAFIVLAIDVTSRALVPAKCGPLAAQILALDSNDPPLQYYTLVGLFLFVAKQVQLPLATPQSLLEQQMRLLQAYRRPNPTTFLADSSQHLFGEQQHDQYLLGRLFIIRCLLAGFDELQTFQPDLLLDIWNNCLMAYPSNTGDPVWQPRCTTSTTRQGAFCLLVDLTKYPPAQPQESSKNGTPIVDVTNANLAFIMQQIPRVVHNVKQFHEDWEWQWDPHLQMKATTTYSGLRNLGCTCYMNSTLQQLFMIPSIRSAVLSMDVSDPANDPSGLFKQVQRLFAYLQATELKSVDPQPLIACLTDEAGGPLNVMVQQDAEEFLTKFCDNLGEFLKKLSTPPLFDGTICTQLVCQGGCNTIRETAATSFVCMTVEVKGHDSLLHSLKGWSDGELLNGVNCDACGSKQDTMKRDCMATLPTTLLLHLKRFELNFDTFLREKVNDEFSFPLTLDMFPYTKAGLQGESGSEIYHLVGCVVHMGSTESGHYYSLIQDRGSKQWIEFNDENVTPFDMRMLEAECFGGFHESTSSGGGIISHKSAYLLVYEKEQHLQNPQVTAIPPLPPSIVSDLRNENEAFIHACYAHEQEFLNFVCTLLEQLPVETEMSIDMPQWSFIIAAVECIPLYTRAFTTSPLQLITLVTKHIQCPTLATYILGQFVKKLSVILDCLLHCTKSAVRTDFAGLLLHLCSIAVVKERLMVIADAQRSAEDDSQSIVGRLVDVIFLFTMMDNVVSHWRQMHEFFTFVHGLATLDPVVRDLLRARKCGMYLLDLYLGDMSPLMGKQYKAYSRKRLPKTLPPSALVLPLATVALLYHDQPHPSVDPETRSCLLLRTLYIKAFAHAEHAKAISALLVQWSWEWEAFTTSVISVVGEVVASLSTYSTTISGLVWVLDAFLGLTDSLQETRIANWFEVMWKSIDGLKSAQAQGQCVGVLLIMGHRHPAVHASLVAHLDTWGPSGGAILGLMAKQPWTLLMEMEDKTAIEWTHARSHDRMTQLLIENGRSLEWLEVQEDMADALDDGGDPTAYLWDAAID
ncbi:unnamed protein product [Aphanomyces euteiches]